MSELKKCQYCGGSGTVVRREVNYVTRDMAIDAECRELEGQEIWQDFQEQCEFCEGTGIEK